MGTIRNNQRRTKGDVAAEVVDAVLQELAKWGMFKQGLTGMRECAPDEYEAMIEKMREDVLRVV